MPNNLFSLVDNQNQREHCITFFLFFFPFQPFGLENLTTKLNAWWKYKQLTNLKKIKLNLSYTHTESERFHKLQGIANVLFLFTLTNTQTVGQLYQPDIFFPEPVKKNNKCFIQLRQNQKGRKSLVYLPVLYETKPWHCLRPSSGLHYTHLPPARTQNC